MKKNTAKLTLLPPADVPTPRRSSPTTPPQRRTSNKLPTRQTFLRWEISTRDTIDVKKIYIDVAGDLIAGIVLSQIVYWHLPARDGHTKMRVVRNNLEWLAKSRDEWWSECRVKGKRLDRALGLLDNIIEKKVFKFNGDPTLHVRLKWPEFLAAWQTELQRIETAEGKNEIAKKGRTKFPKAEFPNSRSAKNEIPKSGTSSQSKNTSKNTSKTTTTLGAARSVVVEAANAVNDIPPDVLITQELWIEAGVAAPVAKKLIAEDSEEARRQVDYLPFRPGIKDQAATLVTATKEKWPPPAPFLKDQARQATAQADADRRRSQAQQATAQKAQKEEAAQRAQDENDQLDAYYKSLPAPDRADIDDQAARRVAPLSMAGLKPGAALAAARRNILRKELGQLIEDDSD
jgi:hypothetical protein